MKNESTILAYTKLLFLFCTFGFAAVFAQAQQQPEQNLHWLGVQRFEQPAPQNPEQAQTRWFLRFRGAFYPNGQSMLPFFGQNIDLASHSSSGNVPKARLTNLRFESLAAEEKKAIAASIKEIPSRIELKQKIAFRQKKTQLQLWFLPLRQNPATGQIEKLVSFRIDLSEKQAFAYPKNTRSYASQSVLASGNWAKIAVTRDGIYRLSFAQLEALGISNPQNVRLFGNGGGMLPIMNDEPRKDDLQENRLWKTQDAIVFYAKGPTNWTYNNTDEMFVHQKHRYSDRAYYFLTSTYDSGFDNQIPQAETPSESPDISANTFTHYDFHELDSLNFNKSGARWYGEAFEYKTSQNFSFQIPDVVSGSTGRLKVSAVGRSATTSSFTITAGGLNQTFSIAPVSYNDESDYGIAKTQVYDFSPQGNPVTITLNYNKSTASSEGWLDYLVVNAERELRLSSGKLLFSYGTPQSNETVEFTLKNANSNTRIWDVTQPCRAKKIQASLNGSEMIFKVHIDTVRRFVAFNGTSFQTPVTQGKGVGSIANQNLHGLGQPDMLIVTPPMFLSYANELADLHRNHDNLTVEVVEPEQIYNEFSSGTPDVAAIRDFMKMLYDRAGSDQSLMPRYLLLFGDGSYDNKNISTDSLNNSNLILTYQSENSLHGGQTFVSDDFFALLDPGEGGATGLVDVGVGRFPVRSTDQAAGVLSKIKTYLSPQSLGDWRNMLCFIGDDEDGNRYMRDAERMADYVNRRYPTFNFDKIYLDAFQQVSLAGGNLYPGATQSFQNRIRQGALIVNYAGHGNELGLAHESLISLEQIRQWRNSNKLPLFVTATCEFSRFDDYARTSAGEYVLLNPYGGGIGLFTTTRLVYGAQNAILNEFFYKYIFEKDENGENLRFGDVICKTKTDYVGDMNKRKFMLLGDPALQLPFPSDSIMTEKMEVDGLEFTQLDQTGKWLSGSGKPTQALPTLSALSRVTVSGYIKSATDGSQMSDFNGTLYPVVFDKEETKQTLSNDGLAPFVFQQQESALYKGKVSVKNGEFSFSFIVPKDIAYKLGRGRISYYADNGQADAMGMSEKLIVGGFSNSPIDDDRGPDIELYLNDESFVSGGTANQNPVLLAYVSDSSGINTVGNGIGHDIRAVLDENTQEPIVLNDSYQADLDSYQSGKVEYQFNNLAPGLHTLNLRVWDVLNNSSEAEIDFTVVNSEDFSLKNLFNFPNPFTQKTWFFFEHNQPFTEMDVLIQIFSISGKLVKTIQMPLYCEGFRSPGIFWDGHDDYGEKIGKGVYIYRLKIRTADGKSVEKYEKLLILK